MGSKKISVRPRQNNIKHTVERVGISVENGNIDIYDMTDNVIVHVVVIEHDNEKAYVVERNKEGKIESRTAGKYYGGK